MFLSCGRMSLDSDDSGVFTQREDCPVSEIVVQRHQYAISRNTVMEDQIVGSAALSDVMGADDIVTLAPQEVGQVRFEHLVKIDFHLF